MTRDKVLGLRLNDMERKALDELVRATPGTATAADWLRLQIREGITHQLTISDEEIELGEALGVEPWQVSLAKVHAGEEAEREKAEA